jgi:23S rRNA (guanine745-N1)-methyltransferase
MHSKAPGDNKLMIDAREAFLKKDYYKPLCDEIIRMVKKYNHNLILDAGCGEGYYTSKIAEECSGIFGVDISKNALVNAFKKDKKTKYAVASLFNLPFFDESFDVVPLRHNEEKEDSGIP